MSTQLKGNFSCLAFFLIKVKEDTLLDMAQHMTDNSKIALVHQLPFTSDREGFAATFEKVCVFILVSF